MQHRLVGPGGFTLIEMMIVTTLIAIVAVGVAGIVQQQAATARRIATEDAVFQTRQAIAIYRQQTGRLPNLLAGWEALTERTTVNGMPVGPFLNRPPRNQCIPPDANQSCIADGNAPTLYLEQCSFLYDYNGGTGTGRFIASFERQPIAHASVGNDEPGGAVSLPTALNQFLLMRLPEVAPQLLDKFAEESDLFAAIENSDPELAAKLLAEFEASGGK